MTHPISGDTPAIPRTLEPNSKETECEWQKFQKKGGGVPYPNSKFFSGVFGWAMYATARPLNFSVFVPE